MQPCAELGNLDWVPSSGTSSTGAAQPDAKPLRGMAAAVLAPYDMCCHAERVGLVSTERPCDCHNGGNCYVIIRFRRINDKGRIIEAQTREPKRGFI